MRWGMTCLAAAAVVGGLASPTAAGPKSYGWTDLGLPTGGAFSIAFGVNARGDIVGAAFGTDGNPTSSGFLLPAGGGVTVISAGGPRVQPRAINPRGDVAVSGDFGSHWRAGTLTPLGMTAATAVNERGTIAGYVSGGQYAATWDDGVVTTLPSLGGEVRKTGYALAINARGVVVGQSLDLVGELQPTMWVDGVPSRLTPLAGDDAGGAFGINDRGWIVGYTYKVGDGTHHPVLWRDGVPTALAGIGTAYAVNNRGVVVGATFFDSAEDAFVWEDGVLSELPDAGDGFRSAAYAINERGDIVGWAWTSDGGSHAALWTR